ncbi:uncharacterized protein LOC123037923 [Drosophila rhopaloa]|uniref:RNA-directed DNA polymerase n=1 Tax=Drosophila rhopaloa TaxID=1041015 RepID=A0ABM5JD17_DRORH|nr:uncharacterized protein LOC123037923 [Drosophila rhopaloa]
MITNSQAPSPALVPAIDSADPRRIGVQTAQRRSKVVEKPHRRSAAPPAPFRPSKPLIPAGFVGEATQRHPRGQASPPTQRRHRRIAITYAAQFCQPSFRPTTPLIPTGSFGQAAQRRRQRGRWPSTPFNIATKPRFGHSTSPPTWSLDTDAKDKGTGHQRPPGKPTPDDNLEELVVAIGCEEKPATMGVRWISYRRKEELEGLLKEFGLETAGTVAELRTRLADFIGKTEHGQATLSRLAQLEALYPEAPSAKEVQSRSTSPMPEAGGMKLIVPGRSSSPGRMTTSAEAQNATTASTDRAPRDAISAAVLTEKLRSWGILFDGQTDPVHFVERVEEGAAAYNVRISDVPRAISGLLSGRAEGWYRAYRMHSAPWLLFKTEFLEFFLPPRYFQRLEDTIRTRYQQPQEPFKNFLVDLRLMMQRAKYTLADELERIYENLLPEYQLFIRRHEFSTLETLTQLATAYEIARDRDSIRHAALAHFATMGSDQAHRSPSYHRTTTAREPNAVPLPIGVTNHMISDEDSRPVDIQRACRRCAERRADSKLLSAVGKRTAPPLELGATGDSQHTSQPVKPPLRLKDGRIVATISINGRPFLATLDTGASRSFVSERVAQTLATTTNRKAVRTRISLADGSSQEVTKAVWARVKLDQQEAELPLLVLPTILDDVILGIDFLCAIQASLICGRICLRLLPAPPRDATTATEPETLPADPTATNPPRAGVVIGGHPRDPLQQSSDATASAGSRAMSSSSRTTTDASSSSSSSSPRAATATSSPLPCPRATTATSSSSSSSSSPRATMATSSSSPSPRATTATSSSSPSPNSRAVPAPPSRPPGRPGPTMSSDLPPHAVTGGASKYGLTPLADAGVARERNPFRNQTSHDKLTANLAAIAECLEEQQPQTLTGEPMEPRTLAFLEEELKQFDGLAGVTHIAEHQIVMRDEKPLKQRYFPKNPAMQQIISDQVDELLRDGRIEPSRSPHSAPIVLVRKKTGEMRMCVDFRQLNAHSVPDAYPLPRIHHILERLRNARYISTLDLKNGYWQIPVAQESRACTAFTVPGRGLFQWRVMPFGLHSAPATFQRALDSVIGPDLEPHAFAYLDDIIVTGATREEHMQNLKEVFKRLRNANLRLNRAKCKFFCRSLVYLGHVISEAGIQTDPDKIAAIKGLQPPTNCKELRRCLGVASWYRRFVPNFAAIVQPMSTLLRKGKRWLWEEPQQLAFEDLKNKLTEAPVLACPDFTRKFQLQTDASDYGLGAVLTQQAEEGERVVAYASRRLVKSEENYSATEKECLAIVWAIRKLRCYLEGYRFDVITDHLALKWLNTIENPTGRIARWALELQQFQFDVHYRKGNQNVVADALSRQPLDTLHQLQEALSPCKWIRAKLEQIDAQPEKFPDYARENGQLYRHLGDPAPDEGISPWKLCVPTEHRRHVLEECHDHPSAGHLGIRKTIRRVGQRYFWPGMHRDVRRHVRCCETCQRFKVSQLKPAGKMLTRRPEEPFTMVSADFIGPLPRSRRGNTMLLVFLDVFSKWVEIIPLRKATTAQLELAFRERILSRFGTPRTLICDNGAQFTSRGFKALCKRAGVQIQYTAPYSPQQNPTERANRTIKTMIAQYTADDQRSWDQLLPEISLAVNSSISDSTGFSPAYLVQGREPRLPGAWYDKVTPSSSTTPQPPEDRAKGLQEAYAIARENNERASQEQQRYYNLRRRAWRPLVGSWVLVRTHHLSKASEGFNAKLAPKYTGPYKVVKFLSQNVVRLLLRGSRKRRTASLPDLKEYRTGEADDEEDTTDNEIEPYTEAFASEPPNVDPEDSQALGDQQETLDQENNQDVQVTEQRTQPKKATHRRVHFE